MPARDVRLTHHPDFSLARKQLILAQFEAFILSGFRFSHFQPELASFLERFLTDQPSDREEFWTDAFDYLANYTIDLVYLFDINAPDTPKMAYFFAKYRDDAVRDPAVKDLMHAMAQIMDHYLTALLATWDALIEQVKNEYIQLALRDRRSGRDALDSAALADLEIELRQEVEEAEFEIVPDDDFRTMLAQAAKSALNKPTRLTQPILFDLYRRRLKPVTPRRQPISSPERPRLPIRPKQLKQKKSDYHVKRRRTDRSS
jgi:hypothetical protein